MIAISDYLANKLLDMVLSNVAYTPPATVYLAAFSTLIRRQDNIGTPTEVSYGSYARQAMSWNSALGGLKNLSSGITVPTPSSGSGNIVAWAICDALTSGNILFFANPCPVSFSNGTAFPPILAGGVKIGLGW